MFLAADAQRAADPVLTCGERRVGLAGQERVLGQNVGFRGERIVDAHQRLLGFDFDLAKLRRAARGVAGLRDDDEHRLVVKLDAVGRQNGVIAGVDRAGIVAPGDILCREHANNAGRGAYRGKLDRFDPTACHRRAANGEMQRAFRLANVVHVDGAAANVAHRGIVPRGHADGARRSFGYDVRSLREFSDRQRHPPEHQSPASHGLAFRLPRSALCAKARAPCRGDSGRCRADQRAVRNRHQAP